MTDAPATSVIASSEAPPIPAPAPTATGGAAVMYPEGKPSEAAPDAQAPAEEPKGEGEAPAEPAPKEEPKAAEPKDGPPADAASYEIKLPEAMKVDDTLLGKFKETAFAAGLDNAKAQQFVDLYATALEGQAKLVQEANLAAYDAQQNAWRTEIEAMPEFQGEAKTKSMSILGRFMDEFGSPEARQAFEVTGAGNSPHIIRMILNASQSLMEGEPMLSGRTIGKSNQPSRKSGPETFYGEKG